MSILEAHKKALQEIIKHKGDCKTVDCVTKARNTGKKLLKEDLCPFGNIGRCELTHIEDPAALKLAKEKLETIKKLEYLEKLK